MKCHFGHLIRLFITPDTNMTRNPAKKNCLPVFTSAVKFLRNFIMYPDSACRFWIARRQDRGSENMTNFLCLRPLPQCSGYRGRLTRKSPGFKPQGEYEEMWNEPIYSWQRFTWPLSMEIPVYWSSHPVRRRELRFFSINVSKSNLGTWPCDHCSRICSSRIGL